MPTFITLIRYTQKGMENIKSSPERVAKVKEMVKAAGGEAKAFYLTMGRYDAVFISEGPDLQTAARVLLAIGMQGYAETETLPALTEDEYRRVIATLP